MNSLLAHIVTIATAITLSVVLPDSILTLVGCFALGWWAVDIARWLSEKN